MSPVTPNLIPAVIRRRAAAAAAAAVAAAVVAAQEWPEYVKKGLFVHLLETERVNVDQQQPLVGDLA